MKNVIKIYVDRSRLVNKSLYKNSILIFLNTLISAITGLVFWMLASRLYSAHDIGIATALLSSIGIITGISSFGLYTGLIRFLPEKPERSLLFNSVLNISILATVVLGIAFIIGKSFFVPNLELMEGPWFYIVYMLLLIVNTIATVFNYSFLALRRVEYSFVGSLIVGLRVFLLIPVAFAGILGIIGSFLVSYIISILISIYLLFKLGVSIRLVFNIGVLNRIIKFSLANYAADILLLAESSILPILTLKLIGAKETAYFYMAFCIASLLLAIPNAIFLSMFIEGSHGGSLRNTVIDTLIAIVIIMTPFYIAIYYYGDILLSFFGPEYSRNAFELLKLLVISSVFIIINNLFINIKKIQKDLKILVIINFLICGGTILFSYLFLQQFGIVGVGLGRIAGQSMASILILVMLWTNMWKLGITKL